MSKLIARLPKGLALSPLLFAILCFISLVQSKSNTAFVALNLAVPSYNIPLGLQLVLANLWRLSFSQETVVHPWWDFGCFGVTFLTEPEKLDEMRNSVLQLWKQPIWNLMIFRQARLLASQQLRRWKSEPIEWLRWNARAIALGSYGNLEEDEIALVGFDEIQSVTKNLASYEPLLVSYDGSSWSALAIPTVKASSKASFKSGFRLTFKLASYRSHGLWWSVVKSEPEVALVVAELLGGGTGALWFQILRGDKPIAYDAIAQVQFNPFGAEISLYASALPQDFKFLQKRTRQLLADLKQGKVDEGGLKRAILLAQLRLKEIECEPLSLSQMIAVWLISGRSLSDWGDLSSKLQSLSLNDLKNFCRSIQQFSELLAVP
ncbi:MAG: insulinase family protein [Armatimonadetes bacterium]|nr:insulinase family protein [Armatimonadota bacterium]